jgi:hypothetical protein
MASRAERTSPFDDALGAVPTCALDESGVVAQRDRYARLARAVQRVEREREAVLIEFRPGYDRSLLEEALAVERVCCPFFVFDLDEKRRLLRTTVRDPDQVPALDAIAQALGAGQKAGD